jgi:8-oxo-dGTP pyrophosphatase MutT (NUDIX family)
MVDSWQKEETERLGDYYIFRLRRDRSRSPQTGDSHDFFVLEAPDWINVVPVTPDGQVVLIRQYRHGVEQVTLEIPGGMVDDGEADPLEAARRELLEETGYEPAEIVPIGMVAPNPAFLDNRCYTFLARDVRQVRPPQFDGTEYIELETVPLATIPELIRSRRITHALVVAAFYHLDHFLHS